MGNLSQTLIGERLMSCKDKKQTDSTSVQV